MQTDLVIVSEYCQKCHIDPSFIILLEEGGLIDINITDGERYLFSSQLRDLEQYTRMYYDLSINIEGIEVSRSGAVVARWAHNPKVVSSSLASATKKSSSH